MIRSIEKAVGRKSQISGWISLLKMWTKLRTFTTRDKSISNDYEVLGKILEDFGSVDIKIELRMKNVKIYKKSEKGQLATLSEFS